MLTANTFHIWSTLAGLGESTKGIFGSGNEEVFLKYFPRFSIICCHVIVHVTTLNPHFSDEDCGIQSKATILKAENFRFIFQISILRSETRIHGILKEYNIKIRIR